MKRRIIILLSAVTLCIGVAMLAGHGISRADEHPDSESVKTAVNGFFAALSSRDIGKMAAVWKRDPNIILVNPNDRAAYIGWDAVEKNWQSAFDAWAELTVTPQDIHVRIIQGAAEATALGVVTGLSRSGQAVSFTAVTTQTYEKYGDRWLLVSHHASRTPK